MVEENTGKDFILKEIEKTRNYFIEEIKHIELIRKKHEMVCKILNYIEHLLILASTGTGVLQVLLLLLDIPVGIASSAIAMIITVVQKYKTIKQRKRNIK